MPKPAGCVVFILGAALAAGPESWPTVPDDNLPPPRRLPSGPTTPTPVALPPAGALPPGGVSVPVAAVPPVGPGVLLPGPGGLLGPALVLPGATGPPPEPAGPMPRLTVTPPNPALPPPILRVPPPEAPPLPRPQPFGEGLPPAPGVQELQHQLETLRAEREALTNERNAMRSSSPPGAGPCSPDDPQVLQSRVVKLLTKLRDRARAAKAPVKPPRVRKSTMAPAPGSGTATAPPKQPSPAVPPTTPHPAAAGSGPALPAATTHPAPVSPPSQPGKSTEPTSPPTVLTESPVDPLSLAQALFRAGDYPGALKAYRELDTPRSSPEERLAAQYMIASCLRKQGKLDEAVLIYREVANSEGDEVLVEMAQWHLGALRARRDLETQLQQLRERRVSLMGRKP